MEIVGKIVKTYERNFLFYLLSLIYVFIIGKRENISCTLVKLSKLQRSPGRDVIVGLK